MRLAGRENFSVVVRGTPVEEPFVPVLTFGASRTWARETVKAGIMSGFIRAVASVKRIDATKATGQYLFAHRRDAVSHLIASQHNAVKSKFAQYAADIPDEDVRKLVFPDVKAQKPVFEKAPDPSSLEGIESRLRSIDSRILDTDTRFNQIGLRIEGVCSAIADTIKSVEAVAAGLEDVLNIVKAASLARSENHKEISTRLDNIDAAMALLLEKRAA